ncbi:MAG: Phenylalanine-tRNA ligase alpha subunit [Candidatus Woesebacteria bacterium GW2011_GWA1_44_23]|uniref:Phenylalanine-tRNA ligase alpha subunit n=1 Tax=Candidatus Woesebacteria bacterium GW2011_GWA1_44_23 TaxID=1618558 RepID=A0A837I952_9BACT|nr:MAG: Phenylalanine-tRNA ligase alpha subunit [Candidatus Woesebacteria bacterium GW2011_GWA1_44_23]
MQEELINLRNEAIAQISGSKDSGELEELRAAYLGRNGKFTLLVKKIKDVPADQRKTFGITLNESKVAIENLISDKKQALLKSLSEKRDWFDLTMPGFKPSLSTQKEPASNPLKQFSERKPRQCKEG